MFGRLVEHSGIAVDVGERKMGVGALRTPMYQLDGCVISASELAAFHAGSDQVTRSHDAGGIKRESALVGMIGALEHLLATPAV